MAADRASTGHNVVPGASAPQGPHAGPMRHLHHATASIMADSYQVCCVNKLHSRRNELHTHACMHDGSLAILDITSAEMHGYISKSFVLFANRFSKGKHAATYFITKYVA